MERNCKHCNETFSGGRKDKEYCTDRCSRNAQAARYRLKHGSNLRIYDRSRYQKGKYKPVDHLPRNCHYCGNQFLGNKQKVYCSEVCSIEGIKKKNRERHFYKDGRGATKTCTCLTCNGLFQTNHKKKYCSPECNPNTTTPWDNSMRLCNTCGINYTPKQEKQKYCSRKCNPYGKKHKDPFYQTKEWKAIRASFILLHTVVNGLPISNEYCIECYRKQNRLNDMYAVDHIVRRKDGGSDEHSNLQSLCRRHHQSKSATEGNRERYKYLNETNL